MTRAFVAIAAALAVAGTGCGASQQWSTWKPPAGGTQEVARAIAAHVSAGYRVSANGGRLVAVIASKPRVAVVAVRKVPQNNKGIQIFETGKTESYAFCGLGRHCSIATGVATSERGQLVRREALEVALYTFKFVPGIDSILAFLPPVRGQTPHNVLFLRRSDLQSALDQPLADTLPRAKPPLPTDPDAAEAATIDKLTLPHLYSYVRFLNSTGGRPALILDLVS